MKTILSRFKESKNRAALAVAAMAVMVLLCLPVFRTYFFQQAETIHAYKTMIGEQKTLTLSDGSILKMNVRSALSVRMRNLRRQVELNEGEVFFAVAVDPDRPFEVRTPNGLIRVLGTAFNVKSRSGRVAVFCCSLTGPGSRDRGGYPGGRAVLFMAKECIVPRLKKKIRFFGQGQFRSD